MFRPGAAGRAFEEGKVSICYVGRCRGCNQVVAAVVADDPNYPRKEVARDVAGFIREGLILEKMDTEQVRVQFQRCICPKSKMPKELELDLQEGA